MTIITAAGLPICWSLDLYFRVLSPKLERGQRDPIDLNETMNKTRGWAVSFMSFLLHENKNKMEGLLMASLVLIVCTAKPIKSF